MSDSLLEVTKTKLEYKLRVTKPPLSYVNQKHIAESFAIPYPVLIKWHELVGDLGLDYVYLLNYWIPGQWFKVSREADVRIEGRLSREAGEVVRKYTGKKVGGRKRKEAQSKSYTLCIRERELVIPNEIEEKLCLADEEIRVEIEIQRY